MRYAGLAQEPSGLFEAALRLFASQKLDFVDGLLATPI